MAINETTNEENVSDAGNQHNDKFNGVTGYVTPDDIKTDETNVVQSSDKSESQTNVSRDTALRRAADKRRAADAQEAQQKRNTQKVTRVQGQNVSKPESVQEQQEQIRESRDPMDTRAYLDQETGEKIEHDAPVMSPEEVANILAENEKTDKGNRKKKSKEARLPNIDLAQMMEATNAELRNAKEPENKQVKPFSPAPNTSPNIFVPKVEDNYWTPSNESGVQGEFRGSTYRDFRDSENPIQYASDKIDPFTVARYMPKSVQKNMKPSEIEDSIADQIDIDIADETSRLFPNIRPWTEDKYLEKDENGKYANEVNTKEEQNFNVVKMQEEMMKMHINPSRIKFEGAKREEVLDENGNGTGYYVQVLTPRMTRWLDEVAALYPEFSRADAERLMLLRASIGIDKNKEIIKEDSDKYEFKEDDVVNICFEIIESQKRFKHPLGMLPRADLIIGGTRCFPQGYMPRHLLVKVMSNPETREAFGTPSKLNREIHRVWIEETQPAIIANTTGDKIKQRYAIYNMMRAMLALDGQDTQSYNISSLMDLTVAECMDETSKMREATQDRDLLDAQEDKDRRLKENSKKLDKRYNRTIPIKDRNGNITGYEKVPKKENIFFRGAMITANFMRAMGVVGNVPLIATGYLEHMTGTLGARIGNSILLNMDRLPGMESNIEHQDFTMTQYLKEAARSKEAKEALQAIRAVENVAGMSAMNVFVNSNRPLTKDSAYQWIEEYIKGRPENEKQGLIRKLNKVAQRVNGVVQYLLPGDFGMEGFDANRMFEMLLYNYATTANGNNITDGGGYLTNHDLEEAIRTQGIEKAIKEIMQTTAGSDAFIASTNLTLGRHSGWSYAVKRVFQANGIVNLALSVTIDKYLIYGVNMVQNFMPMSNTLSYLTTRGVTRVAMNITGNTTSEARDNQLGGNDAFWEGFKKNFIYDAMKIGNFGTIAVFGFLVIQALGGIGEPEDPNDIFNWLAYRIGGNDEDKSSGVEVIPAFYLNDLAGWGLPLAITMAVHNEYHDPNRTWHVFKSGCFSMLEGGAITDMIEFITKGPENIHALQAIDTEDWTAPEDWQSWAAAEAEHFGAQFLKNITPSIINSYRRETFGPLSRSRDSLDSSTSKVFDTEHYDPKTAREEQRTTSAGSYEELRRRSDSVNNILYAALLDFMNYGTLSVGEDSEGTGYQWWEMPYASMKDQTRITISKAWGFSESDDDYAKLSTKEKEEFKATLSDNLLEELALDYDNDPIKFVANGGFISVDTRIALKEYCFSQIYGERQNFIDNVNAGAYPSYVSYEEAKLNRDKKVSSWYDVIKKWCDNEDIPWRDTGYYRQLTNFTTTYEWLDGTPATWDEWIMNGDSVNKVIKPTGNHPSSIAPFTTVDKTGKGFNGETIVNWYKDGITDIPKLSSVIDKLEETGDDVIPLGRDTDKHLAEVIFGGTGGEAGLFEGNQERLISEENGVPTIGYRAYVPAEGSLPDRIKNMTYEEYLEEQGLNSEDSDNKSSNGSSYRGYSNGGGSSYNPKIYSNSHNVNADKAQSMSVRQPYNATKTYLRPDFETKGSREAYKRSDF